MGDYGWSMNFDTPQGIDAVEYGRVLEFTRTRGVAEEVEDRIDLASELKLSCRLCRGRSGHRQV